MTIRLALFYLRRQLASLTPFLAGLLIAAILLSGFIFWSSFHVTLMRGIYDVLEYTDRQFEAIVIDRPLQWLPIRLGGAGIITTVFTRLLRVFSFVLPLLGFIFSYNSVSSDLENGRMLSLRTLPLAKRTLALANAMGNGMAMLLSLGGGIGLAVVIAWWWLIRHAPDALNFADILRVGLYIGFLLLYTLIFILLGTLISALTRRSKAAIFVCLGIFICIFGLHMTREAITPFSPPPLPVADQVLHEYFYGMAPSREAREQGPIEAQRVAAEALKHMEELFPQIRRHYRIERLLNFLSPANLHIEVASALLQDRFIPPYRIFAPVRLDEAQATIGQSLRYLLPEILFTLAMIMLLFWLNVRALTKLEV